VLARAPDAVRAAWAPALAAGDRRVVLAHQERAARYRLEHVDTRAAQAGGAWTVTGAKSLVPIGDQADAFIVPARVAGAADDPAGIALLLVERSAAGVSTRGYALQDGARAAEVAFDGAPATLLVPCGEGFAVLEQAIDIGIAALAAEGVGVMDRLFELTVDYLNTRKQFGVPIGTFQALRHRVADMKMQLELARSMSYFATLKLAEPPAARRRAVAQAKVQLGHSARFLGQQAIQLHGGIGMTDEYAGSHYFKRLTTMEMQFGDTMHHLGEVAARMQETAGVFVG
jgi:alkylation response protein AidB-like acyl-CoA dehydrogenase